ncbi:MAG: hypothetical protein B1H40_04505 [Candidatus Latescibacteria bacterium 4484_181]|nr:MAG: hypothetical protein B1H40_04505 [Candidatus Latescibacteria bacterium 4484_181]RKY68924.1 MAG: hypothetical protein DRQ02_02705 [Candidatus Latescibacterota bacterium]RKY71425.1 MAG: hypothetical protein DRQ24_07415 [Candidatus Latescibacterota bacterium]
MSKTSTGGFGGLTLRSVLIGVVIAVIINMWGPFSIYRLHSSLVTDDYMPLAVVFLFLLVVAVLNVIFKLINPRFGLSISELIIVFIMGLVGASIPTYGLTGHLIATIAAPYYFATPENHWAEYLHPHIPSWLVPSNKTGAMTWFFEGLPEGAKIPWAAWVIPLFWWLSFVAALFFVLFCIIVILRKQWVEKERLIFPLAQVPLQMVEGAESKSLLPHLFRNRGFWIGFAIPAAIIGFMIANWFNPLFPRIPMSGSRIMIGSGITFGRGFPNIAMVISFPMLGLAYLMSLDVLLGIWLFYLLAVIQVGIFTRIGYSLGSAKVYCSHYPTIGWQGAGAMIFMVLWGLWMARSHLKDVLRKAFNRRSEVDDSGELLSYRTAVLGLILGLTYICSWLYQAGMQPKVLLIFVPIAIIFYIGVARLVAEGGLVYIRAPQVPQVTTTYILGSKAISPGSMAVLAMSYAAIVEIKAHFVSSAAHAAKLADAIKLKKKEVLLAICIALLVSVSVSIWYTLSMGYEHGAYNYGRFMFRSGATLPYENSVTDMINPYGTDWRRLLFLGIGAVVMGGLTFMRYRFVWWPIHPLGYTVASTLPIQQTVFSIFLAWAIKTIIIKIGGVSLYRKALPFFLGIVLGHFFAAGIGNLVDWGWFFGHGHEISGW